MPWKYQTINDFLFTFLAAHKLCLVSLLSLHRCTTRRVVLWRQVMRRDFCAKSVHFPWGTFRSFDVLVGRKSLISRINFSSDGSWPGFRAWEARQRSRANPSGCSEKFTTLIANSLRDIISAADLKRRPFNETTFNDNPKWVAQYSWRIIFNNQAQSELKNPSRSPEAAIQASDLILQAEKIAGAESGYSNDCKSTSIALAIFNFYLLREAFDEIIRGGRH